jgi:hypothetical protein
VRAPRRPSILAPALAAAALVSASPAHAAGGWTVRAPAGGLRATVAPAGDGTAELVVRRGSRVLLRAPLGLRTARGDLSRGLRPRGASPPRPVVERYTTVAGKRRRHRSALVRRTIAFSGGDGARLLVDLRVAADGVAFRYRLPERRPHRVLAEATAFDLPPRARTWMSAYQEDDPPQRDPSSTLVFYEAPRTEQAARDLRGDYVYPALAELGGGEHVLLTESALDGGYAGTHLRAEDGGRLRVVPPRPDGRIATRGPLTTPWRVAVVGSLRAVVASDLVQDVAAPSRVADTGWIRPGSVAWSWNADVASPRSPRRQRAYVRYAARQGWPYVLVDEGWSARWMPGLVRYAQRRGVRVFLWTRFSSLRSRAVREASFARWRRWGIAGVKIDFTLCDCQRRMRWFADVLRRTARHRLMLNFHGTTVPRGIERTWPHVLTVEAVQGGEWYGAFTRLKVPGVPLAPASLVTLPFTRNVVGSMDFTPVLFSARNRATSDGFELATAVVYESGLQHWADGIAGYRRRPLAERVLARVPVAWDETRLVAGRPGREAVLARRRGRTWWVGAISATRARSSRIRLGFLGPGPWRAWIVGDRRGGGLASRSARVRRGDRLPVRLAANGGYVARLVPAERRLRPRGGAAPRRRAA